ncbi:MAG: Rdx family protein [Methanomassiliicoccales archaeon]
MENRRSVRIVYCQPCGYMQKAFDMAKEILTQYGMRYNKRLGVSLEPGDQGIFDVYVDGKLIFSKNEKGRFPETNEVVDALR